MLDNMLALVIVGWVFEALVVGWLMGRRGFDPYMWTIVAIVLGPVALPLAAWNALRPPKSLPAVLNRGGDGQGSIDLLVGFDGSSDSRAAGDAAVALLEGRVGRLTLARVVPFDATGEVERRVEAELDVERQRLGPLASTVVLRGRPADALRDYARRLRYDVIVVGAKGHGKTTLLLGSVATELGSRSPVPVLVAPPATSVAVGHTA